MIDVIVIGLGAMGSAAAMHLARRGARVTGFDQFGPAHDHGSSHGESRLIRQAYFESPAYVPLLKRAYALWDELESATKRALFMRTGLILLGRRVGTASNIAREHGVRVDELSASEARARFPSLRIDDDLVGLFEPGAGWLAVEACVQAHLDEATRAKADLHFGEPVLSWKVEASGEVEVTSARGAYRASKLVIAGGAWSSSLLGQMNLPLQVHRVVQLWFEAEVAHADPCFAFDSRGRVLLRFSEDGGPREGGRALCPTARELPRGGAARRVSGRRASRRELRARPPTQTALATGGRQDVHVHDDARRALHHRCRPTPPPGRFRSRLLGAWLQVLLCRR